MSAICQSLEQLRELACEEWDVVQAVSGSRACRSGRYDDYLLELANRLRSGASDDDLSDYLINVATEALGIDTGSGMRARALMFAKAVREQLAALAS
jgi:hypothetical protein